MSSSTLSIIKPDAYVAGHSGAILAQAEAANFRIVALKLTRLSLAEASSFYAVHKERPFYKELCSYMSSGTVIAFVLQKIDAVAAYRTLIGATDPSQAAAGTIRARFGTSIEANAVHGSDSDENARVEAAFFFSQRVLLAGSK